VAPVASGSISPLRRMVWDTNCWGAEIARGLRTSVKALKSDHAVRGVKSSCDGSSQALHTRGSCGVEMIPRRNAVRMTWLAWAGFSPRLGHPLDALLLGFPERRERRDGGPDGRPERLHAVDGVLPADEQLGAEGEVVADEHPAAGREPEREALVHRVAHADGEPDAGCQGGLQVQHPEEPRVGPGQPVLFRLDDVPGAAERLLDGVEHPGVADGVPPALGRGRLAGVQLVERDEPAARVEHEIGHDTYPLM